MKIKTSKGLVAHWKILEGSGVTLYDGSGRGNSGSLGGGVAANMPVWGYKGLIFDGTNDYIEVPNSNSLNMSGPLSIEAWFLVKSGAADGYIISKNSLGEADHQYAIYWGSSSIFLYFNGTLIGNSAVNSVLPEIFNHIVVSWDIINIKIYINGLLSVAPIAYSTPLTKTSFTVNIGRRKPSNIYFRGNISELKLYNRALRAAEVMRHYNDEKYKYS